MHTVRRAFECEHPFGELHLGVDLASLLVAVSDLGGRSRRVPLDIEGHWNRGAVGTGHRRQRVVQQHAVSFIADTPLRVRHVAHMVGPHLGWLDLQTLP